jgi:hypothetical protein
VVRYDYIIFRVGDVYSCASSASSKKDTAVRSFNYKGAGSWCIYSSMFIRSRQGLWQDTRLLFVTHAVEDAPHQRGFCFEAPTDEDEAPTHHSSEEIICWQAVVQC